MAKRVNYSFEKRQRELEKQKKNEKKNQAKAEKRKLGKGASQTQQPSEDAPGSRPLGSARPARD